MKCKILHESRNRIRVHIMGRKPTMEQADLLEEYLLSVSCIDEAKVYDRTGDIVILYREDRDRVISVLSGFSFDMQCLLDMDVNHTSRELAHEYSEKIVMTVVRRGLKRLLVPPTIRHVISVYNSIEYLVRGIKCLLSGKIEVSVLDATAIGASLLRGDFDTASVVMFMLRIGDILDEWTHKKSVDDLARTMSLNVDNVWLKTESGEEVLVRVSDVRPEDVVIVRTGGMIPLDGKVCEGEAMVNQASITGESLPVAKRYGSLVYAGTVIDEGEIEIIVEKSAGTGRYDRIVKMIEESEKLKSNTETRAMHLADSLVPYMFLGSGITYLLTRNVTKALSLLMVDFSCALKLAMPISVLSAMREASKHGITVKGGKFLEAIANADTFVFDKTGTLTHSRPHVYDVVTFNNEDETEMLRLAACLEEHYPHSIANAVVEEARGRGIDHEEKHSRVEYIVAHGISSSIDGKKTVIGSYHFVFEDEGCVVKEDDQIRFEALPDYYSHLYLAIGGVLSAVILIEDPVRENASEILSELHRLGMDKLVMMTGDSERTAKAIAAEVGVDEYHSEVLPDDKARFIKQEHDEGRTVVMIGDGVNDSPALSEADCGIAVSTGAAIAREVADITITADDLKELVLLKILSDRLQERIERNYRTIISFNGLLILLGVLGIIPPATGALLHNSSTIAIGLYSMTGLLPKDDAIRRGGLLEG